MAINPRVTAARLSVENANNPQSRITSSEIAVEYAYNKQSRVETAGIQVEYIYTAHGYKSAFLQGPPETTAKGNVSAYLNGTHSTSDKQAYTNGTGQSLFPVSDIYSGNWTSENDTTPIYPSLADDNDSTYAYSPLDGIGSYFEVKLDYPSQVSTGTHVIKWRAYRKLGLLSVSLRMELLENGSVIASDIRSLTDTVSDFSIELTQSEISTISDYSALAIRVTIEGME
jgi:hypothetical protein